MDHQFLNVDCHPSALPRPALHPTYAGSSGGVYSLGMHQSSDANSLVNQFNPYRLPTSSDASGHSSSLSSSQFSAFDSFYKAYQSAYSQNSALAGMMFGHPSYRFDGPLLPHDQQLMLQSGFLQYPPLFPNSSLYANLPGSSSNPRYPGDYFGQNLSGLSSFSSASKFNSGPDLASAQSWLILDRSMPSNLVNAFVAPTISSESSKDDRHCNELLTKKDGDHFENRAAFANHPPHQPITSSQIKFARQTEEGSSNNSNSLQHHLSSDSFNHRDVSQRRGNNGEVGIPTRRQEYSYAIERAEDKKSEVTGKDKRGVLASPLCKTTSFPVVTTFSNVSCTADGPPTLVPNFARHSNEYLFNHYASKMYPPNSFSSELLNLQSKTPLGSSSYQHQNPPSFQRYSDKQRQVTKSEDRTGSKNCIPVLSGPKQVPSNQQSVDKALEQKFHRPFELVSGKSGLENLHATAPISSQKIKRSSVKNVDEKYERSFQKNVHQQNSHVSNYPHLIHSSKSEQAFQNSIADRNNSIAEPCFVPSTSSQTNKTKSCHDAKEARAGDETPLNLVRGVGKKEKSQSPSIRILSKLDLEEAWRSSLKKGKNSREDGVCQSDSKYEELFDDYEYEYERKIAKLTTITSSTTLTPSNSSQEKVDFLSSLGLSTIEKCKELEHEKHQRRKRQLGQRGVSPTISKEDEDHVSERGFVCTPDCPHKNGLDKEAMLAMLGLHQIEICEGKGKYFEGNMCATGTPSNMPQYGETSTPYPHSSSSFYPFPSQYPSPQLPTSAYTFYPPGYLINQPSSASLPSSTSSSSSSSSQVLLTSPYCHFYDNPHATSSKTTQSYPYHSPNCFQGHHLYYHQGKDEKLHAKVGHHSTLDNNSSYGGYGNNCNNTDFENQNLLDTSAIAGASGIRMERCMSSTPACRGFKDSKVIENGPSKGNEPSLFHWPGVDSIIEAYHRYIEERTMEKQLLAEHATKLDKFNTEVVVNYEQLKDTISDLRKVQSGLEDERRSTQSQLDVLKNFIMQLK